MGDKRPPPDLLDPSGNIVVPSVAGERYSAIFAWISNNPVAAATRDELVDALGFGPG
ncbi:MAG TPA: hypothetical protein VG795_01555 [Acidimicrobiia bacterium]|nr:hypothetical protein [Acidimicrobiia bacterium]